MNIGRAIERVKQGRRVSRDSWNTGEYIQLVRPSEMNGLAEPTIFEYEDMVTMKGFPWTVCHEELLAEDWHLIRD
jgi:hypothetical protein